MTSLRLAAAALSLGSLVAGCGGPCSGDPATDSMRCAMGGLADGTYERRSEELAGELAASRERLAAAEAQASAADAELRALREARDALERRLAAFDARLRRKEAALAAARAELDRIEAANAGLATDITARDAELRARRADLAEQEQAARGLRDDLEAQQRANEEMATSRIERLDREADADRIDRELEELLS